MITYKDASEVLYNQLNDRNACTLIAYAVAAQKDIRKVRRFFKVMGRRDRCGMIPSKWKDVYNRGGLTLVPFQCNAKTIGKVTQHLPQKGTYLVHTTSHVATVRDGVLEDWSEGRRHRIKQVFKVSFDSDKMCAVARKYLND